MSPEQARFFQEAEALINPPVKTHLEYRIHYDEFGNITMCSMANHPDSARYIVVTPAEYERYFEYVVVDGQLKKIDTDSGYRVQLKRANRGYATVDKHAGILLEHGETWPDVVYYDYRNY
jgi:hypothetical protein